MRKAGIIIDNYKQDKYEAKLKEIGLPTFTVQKYKDTCKIIKVDVSPEQETELAKAIQGLEFEFSMAKRRN